VSAKKGDCRENILLKITQPTSSKGMPKTRKAVASLPPEMIDKMIQPTRIAHQYLDEHALSSNFLPPFDLENLPQTTQAMNTNFSTDIRLNSTNLPNSTMKFGFTRPATCYNESMRISSLKQHKKNYEFQSYFHSETNLSLLPQLTIMICHRPG